ncbi:MAG: diacylglycerol O-acyltransferase, partial [Glaciecola sp.]
MRRLAGKDAMFVYADSPRTPMHIAFAGIFDPSTVPGGAGDPGDIYRRFVEHFASRVHLFPPFRQKLVKVPFGLNHPILIEDPEFDLEYHIRRTALPAPGGMRELEAFFGRLMSRPMDMSRPMWEGWVVEGLEGGKWAYVAKTHHVLIDGVGGNEALVNLLD